MCTPKLSSEAVKKDCDGRVGIRIGKLHLSLQELRVELEFLEAPFMEVELETEGSCLPRKQRPQNLILGSPLHKSTSSSPLDQTALSKLHLDELSSSLQAEFGEPRAEDSPWRLKHSRSQRYPGAQVLEGDVDECGWVLRICTAHPSPPPPGSVCRRS